MAKGGKTLPDLRKKPGTFVDPNGLIPKGGRKSGAKRPSKGAAGLHS
jgi:hypothetical protein